MTDRLTASSITDAQLDELLTELARAERAVRRAQGSEAWMAKHLARQDSRVHGLTKNRDQWRQRAEQAEDLLRIAHDTSNKSEAERALAAQRAERAEAAIERVAEVLADHNGDDWSSHPATEAVKAAITFRPAPAPGPAATQATAAPDTITDPAYLHDQYAAVIRQWWDADDGGADEIADAVLRVRDRHVAQLRQRLALADGRHLAVDAWGNAFDRANKAEQQRDQLAAALSEVLGEFRVKTHPGESCLTTYNIPVARVQQWRAVLDQTQNG